MEISARPVLLSFVTILITAGRLVRGALIEAEKVNEEAVEDQTQTNKWTEAQLQKFAQDVTAGINDLRKKYDTKPLMWDSDLTKVANFYAESWGSSHHIQEARRGLPWVEDAIKKTAIKDIKDIEVIRDSAILFSHRSSKHIKPERFLSLLKDVNPNSNLLPGVHGFYSDRYDKVIDDRQYKVYCHRLKQLLWTSTEKIGIGTWWKQSGTMQMHYVIFFEKGRKKFEREMGRLTPGAVSFLQEKVNQCRMDYAREQSTAFHDAVYKQILELRTKFSVAFGQAKPLRISPELTQQAKVYAKAWAESNDIDSSRSALPKGHILYAQQMVLRTSEKLGDTDMHWDDTGVILSYESKTTPQDLIKHLLDSDRFGAPMPDAFQLKEQTVPLKVTGPTSTRLRQILCKEATEIGIAAWTYVYNYDEQFPGFGHFVVLLFNRECKTMPKLTNDNIVAKLEADGWKHNKDGTWWHEGDLKQLHKFEKNTFKL